MGFAPWGRKGLRVAVGEGVRRGVGGPEQGRGCGGRPVGPRRGGAEVVWAGEGAKEAGEQGEGRREAGAGGTLSPASRPESGTGTRRS